MKSLLWRRAVSSCTQPPARPHVPLAPSLVGAREGRVAAAGTLAAAVQKLSLWIVRRGGRRGEEGVQALVSGLQTICNVPGYLLGVGVCVGGWGRGGDRYQASVLCAQQLWWDHRTQALRVTFLLDGGQHLT